MGGSRVFCSKNEKRLKDINWYLVLDRKGKSDFICTDNNYGNKKFEDDADKVFERFIVVPTTEFETAADVASLIYQHKPNVWVLDFVTSLAEADEASTDMYMFMKNQLDILKRIVHTTNTFGILLAQMKQNALKDKSVKIPEIADLEWSSKINQYSAYIYMSFYPKNYYTSSYVPDDYYYLYKRKGREAMPSSVPLLAEPKYAKFIEPSGETETKAVTWMHNYSGGKLANK
jgi:hypothetical protein